MYLSLPVNHSTPLSFRVEHSSDCTIYNDPVTPYSHNTMETRCPVSVLLLSDVLEWTQIVEITTLQHNIYSTYDHILVVHILTRKTCNDLRMVKFFSDNTLTNLIIFYTTYLKKHAIIAEQIEFLTVTRQIIINQNADVIFISTPMLLISRYFTNH